MTKTIQVNKQFLNNFLENIPLNPFENLDDKDNNNNNVSENISLDIQSISLDVIQRENL